MTFIKSENVFKLGGYELYILSIDFGTSSLKMGVFNRKGKNLCSTKVEYDFEVIDRFKIQIDANLMFKAFIDGLKKFEEYKDKIEVVIGDVALSMIAMDKEGNPVYPMILHLDRRSYAQSEFALRAVGGDNFMNINGNLPFAGGITCTSMLWIKDNLPDVYKKTYKFGHFNTFFLRKMVGKFLIDPSNASFTGLYETLKEGGWSEDICREIGMDRDKLPDIVPTKSIAGYLSKSAAELTGLREGVPVIVGSNDTASAAFGAGAVNTGDILNVSGSNEIITVTTDNPIPDRHYYIRTSVTPGRWLYLAITVGGNAVEWFRKEFCKDMSKEEFYSEYLQDIYRKYSNMDITEIKEKFEPYLAGDRHSLKKKTGAFNGLTFESTRESMLLGLLIGTYDPVFNTINVCKDQIKLNQNIFWTGGMINDAYLKFKRNIFRGFDFKAKKDCSELGNIKIAVEVLDPVSNIL